MLADFGMPLSGGEGGSQPCPRFQEAPKYILEFNLKHSTLVIYVRKVNPLFCATT